MSYPEEGTRAMPDQSPVAQRIANLQEHADRLDLAIERMTERLVDVLRPSEPMVKGDGGELASVRTTSATVDRLDSLDRRIVQSCDRINELVERLDT
jgi:hypothetical protein